MNTSTIDISLFPIPGSVSLPFNIVSLHIFEPRYRKMILESVEQKRRVGVAHTTKEVGPARVPNDASVDQILSSNLESYEAHTVFSAGFPNILETLPDGRLIIEIEMDSRYEIVEEIQHLPYQIVRCIPYVDTEKSIDLSLTYLRKQLDTLLLALEGPGTDLLRIHLRSEGWKSLSEHQYSFAVFSLVRLEPDFIQMVLEMKSPKERITFIKDLLERKPNLYN